MAENETIQAPETTTASGLGYTVVKAGGDGAAVAKSGDRVSNDLPFAQKRFCAAEGLENVKVASDFRHRGFAEQYGVMLTDGPLAGLTARSIVVIDAAGVVRHTELVAETANEPDYAAALAAL